MKRILLTIALFTLCGTASAITVADLTTNTWMPAVDSVPPCETPATITFGKDGKFFSEPGCNDMFGEYQIGPDGAVTFSNVESTHKFCAKEYNDLEASFLGIFNNIKYIEKDGNYLKLFNADHQPIGAFEPEKVGSCL
ncbi:MAG: META domain-containing protein [Burkholderiales bacterium]|nr:META domain-containing protein [Burkholderiales bacterium]